MSIFKNTKCLVTGSAGMIGSNFVQRLIKENARVYAVFNNTIPKEYDGDLKPYSLMRANLEVNYDVDYICRGIDYVFHCAGKSYGAGAQAENILNLVGPNIKMNYNLLAAAHKAQVKAFVYLSSTTGYPPYDHPVKEEEFHFEDPAEVYFGVGHMKRYSEKLCELFAKYIDNNITCIVPRPSNIVGPRDCFDPSKSHILPALVKKVVDGDDPIEVWGDGKDTRDFLHVDDFIDAVFLMVEKIPYFEPINIAYGKSFSAIDILGYALQHEGAKIDENGSFITPRMSLNKNKPSTLKNRFVDNTRAKTLLGWAPKRNIEKMVADVVDWYTIHVKGGKNG
jgi:GDP-L-fucose synthase